MTKKKIFIAVVGAIALLALLSSCSDVNKSDERKMLTYVHGLHNNVLDNTPDEEIISLGYKVCHALDNGRTFDTVLVYVFPEDKYKSGENIEFAYDIIFNAIDYLCPRYDYQLKE